jgi:hypothetical protein
MRGSVTSPQVVNVADLRGLAKRRLPLVAFDDINGGIRRGGDIAKAPAHWPGGLEAAP